MFEKLVSTASLLDAAALVWFLVAWVGYGWFSERSRWAEYGLQEVSRRYRMEWGRRILAREIRIPDAALVGNLMQSVSFYANTTIYIIAGLLAVFGTLDQVMGLTADLPFARNVSRTLWELKLIVLLGVFIVAYFKFTWAIRQFNILSILIGGSPNEGTEAEIDAAAVRLGTINSLAGDEFNRGIRAYYFGLSAGTWFIQPWIFLILTTAIVVVLYRRDFVSPTLEALKS